MRTPHEGGDADVDSTEERSLAGASSAAAAASTARPWLQRPAQLRGAVRRSFVPSESAWRSPVSRRGAGEKRREDEREKKGTSNEELDATTIMWSSSSSSLAIFFFFFLKSTSPIPFALCSNPHPSPPSTLETLFPLLQRLDYFL